jgi:alpha-L-rhamnosidase
LTWAKGSYGSIRGKIESNWKIADGRLRFEVTIPPNTTATVYVPARDETGITESGRSAAKASGVQFLRMEAGAAMFEVQSGRYSFDALQ